MKRPSLSRQLAARSIFHLNRGTQRSFRRACQRSFVRFVRQSQIAWNPPASRRPRGGPPSAALLSMSRARLGRSTRAQDLRLSVSSSLHSFVGEVNAPMKFDGRPSEHGPLSRILFRRRHSFQTAAREVRPGSLHPHSGHLGATSQNLTQAVLAYTCLLWLSERHRFTWNLHQ